jgi:hypothetical protein
MRGRRYLARREETSPGRVLRCTVVHLDARLRELRTPYRRQRSAPTASRPSVGEWSGVDANIDSAERANNAAKPIAGPAARPLLNPGLRITSRREGSRRRSEGITEQRHHERRAMASAEHRASKDDRADLRRLGLQVPTLRPARVQRILIAIVVAHFLFGIAGLVDRWGAGCAARQGRRRHLAAGVVSVGCATTFTSDVSGSATAQARAVGRGGIGCCASKRSYVQQLGKSGSRGRWGCRGSSRRTAARTIASTRLGSSSTRSSTLKASSWRRRS